MSAFLSTLKEQRTFCIFDFLKPVTKSYFEIMPVARLSFMIVQNQFAKL
jgi:hypothetical protein